MNNAQIQRLADEVMDIFAQQIAPLERTQVWRLQAEVLLLLKGANAVAGIGDKQ